MVLRRIFITLSFFFVMIFSTNVSAVNIDDYDFDPNPDGEFFVKRIVHVTDANGEVDHNIYLAPYNDGTNTLIIICHGNINGNYEIQLGGALHRDYEKAIADMLTFYDKKNRVKLNYNRIILGTCYCGYAGSQKYRLPQIGSIICTSSNGKRTIIPIFRMNDNRDVNYLREEKDNRGNVWKISWYRGFSRPIPFGSKGKVTPNRKPPAGGFIL